MNYYISTPLSINLTNTKLNISFSEELLMKDLTSKVDKTNFILNLTEGICTITDYHIQSYDNKNFTIYLKLNFASDGKQILNLDINAHTLKNENIKLNQSLCLNKQDLLFDEDSIIKTDQGDILIKNLKSNKNSINNKKIIRIIKGKNFNNNDLILIKKNSFGENIPSNNTFLKNYHKIFFNNEYLELKDIYFKSLNKDKLFEIKSTNNYFYNIIIDEVKSISLNNLEIELPSYNDLSLFEESFYDFKFIQNIIDKKIEEKFFSLNKNFLIENSDKIIKFKKDTSKNIIDNLDNNLIWNHWINYGFKENRIMNIKYKFTNVDFERYKKNYPIISKELNNENKKIWEHWIKNGIKENKTMHLKISYENADFEKFKKEFPEISNKNNNDDNKIWKYLKKNNDIYKLKTKLIYENCDFAKFKKDYPNLCIRIYEKHSKKNIKK